VSRLSALNVPALNINPYEKSVSLCVSKPAVISVSALRTTKTVLGLYDYNGVRGRNFVPFDNVTLFIIDAKAVGLKESHK
jgi:hypothetical protein